MSEDEYKRYVSPNKIKGFPSVFNKWCRDNKEKLNKARKNNKLPYFVKENQAQIGKLLGWRNVQYEINQRKFQGYLNDQNYTNVKFNHENGAFMATHREHNLDRKKGWYETDVQKIAFDNGYSVILQKEDNTVKNMKNAVVYLPNEVNQDNIDRGIKRFEGLRGFSQWALFEDIFIVDRTGIKNHHHPR